MGPMTLLWDPQRVTDVAMYSSVSQILYQFLMAFRSSTTLFLTRDVVEAPLMPVGLTDRSPYPGSLKERRLPPRIINTECIIPP